MCEIQRVRLGGYEVNLAPHRKIVHGNLTQFTARGKGALANTLNRAGNGYADEIGARIECTTIHGNDAALEGHAHNAAAAERVLPDQMHIDGQFARDRMARKAAQELETFAALLPGWI